MKAHCLKIFVLLLLLVPVLHASATGGDPSTETEPNTMVTGVVRRGDGSAIRNDVEVRIYLEDSLLVKVMTRNGLFSVDLAGKALPNQEIDIVIWADNSRPEYSHNGKKLRRKLADAQNLNLTLIYTFPEYQTTQRPPRGGRYL